MSTKAAPSRRLGKWDTFRLAWRLYRDPRVSPRLKKLVPGLGLLYVLSPIDLVPDLFLGIGQVDDLGVLGLIMMAALMLPRLASAEVLAEHLRAMGLLQGEAVAGRQSGSRAAPGTDDIIEARFRTRR